MLTTEDLTAAINVYLKRRNTQYAIMVDGAWGGGKTHFIVNEILSRTSDIEYLYISLYGLRSIEDIENEIFKSIVFRWGEAITGPRPGKEQGAGISQQTGAVSSGYAVQLFFNRFKTPNVPGGKTLVVCFDDLERWNSDLNVCLSYINKLVEHETVKCILVGNTEELDDKNLRVFSKAREKTIRHIYKFENNFRAIFTISLGLLDYGSKSSKTFLRTLINKNSISLESLLKRVETRNIRIFVEALQLYEYIYRKNARAFNRSKRLAFTYFVTLFSALLLVKRYFINKKERNELLETDHSKSRGFSFLSRIGYFEKNAPDIVTGDSRVLLDIIFYRLDQISLKGAFSVINHGFYVKDDFEGDFDKWSAEQAYESYLDADYFFQLENLDAQHLLEEVVRALLKDRSITNPATLLLLSERIISDIERNVVDFDLILFKKSIIETVGYLYESGKMERVEINFFDSNGGRFENCQGLYNYVMELNAEYLRVAEARRLADFWNILRSNPGQFESQLNGFYTKPIFSQYKKANEITVALEALNNAQLLNFIKMIQTRRGDPRCSESVEIESEKSKAIGKKLGVKYSTSYGVRACHFRQLADLLTATGVPG